LEGSLINQLLDETGVRYNKVKFFRKPRPLTRNKQKVVVPLIIQKDGTRGS
jgi:hypothetical protein